MRIVLQIKKDLESKADSEKAKIFKRFFKTGKGEYGEGDEFLGLTVPQCRMFAKKYQNISLTEIKNLLHSKIHEERLIALIILTERFIKENEEGRREIFNFYLQHTHFINNWDLVDLSAGKIAGFYLFDKSKDILFQLVKSKSIWERRIAIIATYYFIKQKKVDETLTISKMLLSDSHDLIHKAVGWMLREVGKVSQVTLEKFIKENYKEIPRTTLRYAIERFPQSLRKEYLLNK